MIEHQSKDSWCLAQRAKANPNSMRDRLQQLLTSNQQKPISQHAVINTRYLSLVTDDAFDDYGGDYNGGDTRSLYVMMLIR